MAKLFSFAISITDKLTCLLRVSIAELCRARCCFRLFVRPSVCLSHAGLWQNDWYNVAIFMQYCYSPESLVIIWSGYLKEIHIIWHIKWKGYSKVAILHKDMPISSDS